VRPRRRSSRRSSRPERPHGKGPLIEEDTEEEGEPAYVSQGDDDDDDDDRSNDEEDDE